MNDFTRESAEASSEASAEKVSAPDVAPDDVSRETARRIFADRLPTAVRYAESLATDGVVRGLIGPREVPRLWDRHVFNCAVLAELVPTDADVLDVGSGAGLPGIPLAIARPDLFVTLVEPMERRAGYLRETVDRLGLGNVDVLRARAEDVEPKGKADMVTCRAVANLDKLAGWCLPLVRSGGELLAIKGASAPDEIAARPKAGARWRDGKPVVVQCGTDLLDTPTTVIRMRRR